MQINDIIEYWITSAEEAHQTAKSLFASKHYMHSLFFCHLAVEKIIKALVTYKTDTPAPHGHNLFRLAELSGIPFSKEQSNDLDEINSFNIKARYDDYKFDFYKKATKEYAENYIKKTDELYLWIKEQIKK